MRGPGNLHRSEGNRHYKSPGPQASVLGDLPENDRAQFLLVVEGEIGTEALVAQAVEPAEPRFVSAFLPAPDQR